MRRLAGPVQSAALVPVRRPYASRGAPRPATTRRSASRSTLWRLLAPLGLVAVIAVGTLATLNPFASHEQLQPPRVAPTTEPSQAAPADLQMGDIGALTIPTPASEPAASQPTQEPTFRHWAARAPGIVLDQALARRLDRVLVGVDGTIGVAVRDLGSGRGAVLDGDVEHQSASLYKLPILYTVFASSVGMGEVLPITDDALSYDAGTMELGPGETLTTAEALERMVTLSDNTSAIMLATRVGPGRISATIAGLGMDTTHYSLARMTTSALDMLQLVELVADGRAVSPAASSDMLHLLLRQRVNDRLPRLLPHEVKVAHKTGNLPGTVNDVGILFGPSSTVAVAVLVSDTSDEAGAASAIARVALAAYTYFEGQPEVSSRPVVPPAPARPIPPVWREPHPPTPTPTVEPTSAALVEPAAPATLLVVTTPRPNASTPMSVPPTPAPAQKPAQAQATATPAPPAPTPTPAAAAATKAPTARATPQATATAPSRR